MERQTRTPPLRGQSRKVWRGSWLLASTALSAVLAHPAPARAQHIAADTTPQGGVVVGGNANIAQSTGSTVITQNSDRAAINWQSYNVGSDAHVTYQQPSSSSITLNRVVTPSPSVIAGHISANGQIVLINQSGVVFTKGAEVTAQSVIVSTSNISNSDFMAGKMNFTGTPNPGAKIVNDGEITAGQAGLVGLVAPQVANNGIISARLGQVVLAGADAFTLDLYGDKLVSLDVTKAVAEVDLNGQKVPALVTNKGLILADGGKITLTAADADALVSQLLQVGGTLRADSAGGQTGTISLVAVGGGINIAGNLLARGNVAGSTGGNVEAVATGTVAVAANAVIDASGQAGGGNIALGTNLQRVAQGASDSTAPRAAVVSIAAGAQIKANAISKGNGGKVTLLSAKRTDFAGTISTTGGTLGGNGGLVEISSDDVISLGGTVIDTAIDGQAGEILLDPQTLIVTSGSATNAGTNSTGTGNNTSTTFGTDSSTISYVNPGDLTNLRGTIILEATQLLSVASAINLSTRASELELSSGQDLTISASISLAGALDINAAGTLDVGAALNASTITLADTGGGSAIDINGVISGTELVINAGGTVTEGTLGGIAVTSLTTGSGSIGGDAVLNNTLNSITTLANFLTTGTLNLADSTALTQTGTAAGADVTLAAAGLTLNGNITATNTLALASSAGITQAGTGILFAPDLTSGSITGNANLTGTANNIGTLSAFSATGTLDLTDNTGLGVTGGVSAQDITIAANGTLALDSGLTAASGGDVALVATALTVSGGSIAAPSGTISIAPYGGGTLDVGGSTAGGLVLSAALLAALDTTASVLNFGSAAGYLASLVELEGNVSLQPTLAVDSSGRVIQAGTLSGQAISFTGNSFTLNGTVNAASLDLAASAAITQASTGALDVTQLAGTAGGNISLAGANSIGTLGALDAAGNIVIDNTGTMVLGGAVSAGTSLALLTNGLLAGGGSLSAGTIAITPYDNGAIDLGGSSVSGLQLSQSLVSELAGNAVVILGSAGGSQASSIFTEGAVSFANALVSLDSTGGLTQTGTLTGTTLGLNAASLALDGAVDATLLNLSASSGITQAGTGALHAATLAGIGSVTGNIVLDGANSITLLNGLDATGTINVQDSIAMDVNGAVSAAVITLAAAGLDLASQISAGTLAVLDSSGSLSQSGGGLNAGTLSGSIAGNASLNGTQNSIATLADFTAGGTLDLTNQTSLTQTGTLTAASATLTAAGLALNGNLTATDSTAGILDLDSTGSLSQSGTLSGQTITLTGTSLALNGAVDATALTLDASTGISQAGTGALDVTSLTGGSSVSGAILLGGTGNVIGTITALTAGQNILLGNSGTTGITGQISAGTNVTLQGGSFAESGGGAIAARTLTGSLTGGLALGGGNAIGTLGALAAGGNVLLADTEALAIAGLVSTTGTLTLTSTGAVSEAAGGTLDTGGLSSGTGSIGGALSLTSANSIGTLGVLDAAGNIVIDNTGTMVLGGAVSAGTSLALLTNGLLAGGGSLSAGTIAITPYDNGAIDLGGSSVSGLQLSQSLVSELAGSAVVILGSAGGSQASSIFTEGAVSFANALVSLDSTGGLTQTGTLTGTTLGLNAASLALDGAVDATLLNLSASSGITQAGTGALHAATLAGIGSVTGNIVLDGANSITLLNGLDATGTINVQDGIAMDVNGAVSAAVITLAAAGLDLASQISAGTLAVLDSSGSLSQSGGGLNAGTLSGSIAGNASLNGTQNSIATLADFTAGGTLDLTNQTSLTQTGTLTAASATLTAAGLALNGNLTATDSTAGILDLDSTGSLSQSGTLSGQTITLTGTSLALNGAVDATALNLDASTGISQAGTGALDVTSLTGGSNVSGAILLGGTGNVIGTITALTAGQNILLGNSGTTGITGQISAGTNVTLQGGSFAESGGGAIAARTLTGSLTGGLALGGGNAIGTLGALAAGGNVLLADTEALAIAGLVSTTGTLTLTSTGAVSEAAGGTLDTGGLSSGTGSIGGALSLTSANSIGTLGALDAAGNIVIANTGTMVLGGAVSAGTSLALLTNGLLAGGGSLSAGTIAITPYDNGAIDLGGSSVSGLQLSQSLVSELAGSAVVILGSAGGSQASSIFTEGAVSFANALVSLDSTGGLTQTGTLTGTTLGLNAASLALDGAMNATLLNLSASSGITQAGTGALHAATLAGIGSVTGNIVLDGANSITLLNGLAATGTINVQDSIAMDVNGAVSAGNSLALSAPGLTLASTLSSGEISLIADSITDNGGAVMAPGGTVSIAPRTANLAVDLGGNTEGLDLSGTLLGAITAAALDISTQGSIIAYGSASVSTPLLSLSGNGITFAGTLSAPGTLALSSGAGVTSTSANHLTAGTLLAGGAITGNADLSQGSNSIATLGSLALSGGSLMLADATALTVNGPLSANAVSLAAAGLEIASQISASGAVALNSTGTLDQSGTLTGQSVSLTGTSLTLNAPVNTGTLALAASNGVSETGGGLNATTLTGSVSGNAVLNGAVNNIGTLANFTDNGTLILTDSAALMQAGSLSATNAALSAAGLNFTGSVTTPGTLALASSNGVSQSGGSVNAGVLSSLGTVSGNIIMTQAANQFPDVQNLAATGVIELTSSTGLGQTGLLSASGVTLTAPSLAFNGTLSTSGALQLNGGSASEGAGAVIDASLLTTGGGSLSGNAVFNNGANNIAVLSYFTANGGLTLADGAALAISGPVSLGGTLALWDASNITQTAGSITAAALTSDGGAIGGNAVFGQSGNLIPVLGAFAAGGNLQLNTGSALNVAGNVTTGGTLSLYSGGAISQSNGLITTPWLNAGASAIDLGGTDIGLLGNVSAGGDVNIANAGGLAGTLTAQDATLGSNGGFTSSGDARIGNALYITAAGPVVQTGGDFSAATATITAPSITLSGATDISNGLALRASGDIVHESGSLNAATLTGTAGRLAEFGAATDIGTLGSFLMGGGTFMLDNDAPLTLTGPLVANVASITAAGALVLDGSADGGLFLSGGTASSTATKPRTGVDSILAVTGGNPSITQSGTFYIDSGPNLTAYLGNATPLATLFMSLASSGAIAIAASPGILEAPNTDLVLAAGAAGVITGNVNVLHLEVLSAKSVDMTGFIASITGPTAAGNGSAFPFPQPGYRFNACPIGSVNCTILPIEGLPQANPLENFDISPRKRRKLDKNVTLPGVAARDF